ncbi:MAG: molybdopterin-binding protein, partial [Chloroflexi bacterium]|nr:molybdopterin-binding protein [Chloroflexota bacterium]
DLYAFYYRDVLTTNSFTYENPWLDEVAQANPFSFNIAINKKVADKKGLKTGDWAVIESNTGRKAKGRIIATETIHPEALGVAGCGGHFTEYQPIAKGKGVRFAELLELDFEHLDPVNLNQDLCVKVKVYKDPTNGKG